MLNASRRSFFGWMAGAPLAIGGMAETPARNRFRGFAGMFPKPIKSVGMMGADFSKIERSVEDAKELTKLLESVSLKMARLPTYTGVPSHSIRASLHCLRGMPEHVSRTRRVVKQETA